jgi:hypothetical protein
VTDEKKGYVACYNCQRPVEYPYLTDSKTRAWHHECASTRLAKFTSAFDSKPGSCPGCGRAVGPEKTLADHANPRRTWHHVTRSCASATLGTLPRLLRVANSRILLPASLPSPPVAC